MPIVTYIWYLSTDRKMYYETLQWTQLILHLHEGEICDLFRQYMRAIYKAKQLARNNHNNTDEQVATNPMT